MIRHIIHDTPALRLVVEPQVHLVTVHLSWGLNDGDLGKPSKASAAIVHLCPAAARDRVILNQTIEGLERIAGLRTPSGHLAETATARLVPLDAIHRSIMDITRRPTA